MDMTTRSQQAVSAAVRLASERGNPATEPVHLGITLLEDTEGLTRPLLQALAVDPATVRSGLEQALTALPRAQGSTVGAPQASRAFLAVISAAEHDARERGDDYVSTEHLLLALADAPGAREVFARVGVTAKALSDAIASVRGSARVTSADPEGTFQALEKYSVDLTARAREGKIDPVIGRDSEIRRVVQVLSRRTKNNPVLIGEPGVGKTAVVEGLGAAHRRGRRPGIPAGQRLMSLDLASMVAGAKYRGEFEERLKAVLTEITDSGGQVVTVHRRASHRRRARVRPARARWTPATCSNRCSPAANCG